MRDKELLKKSLLLALTQVLVLIVLFANPELYLGFSSLLGMIGVPIIALLISSALAAVAQSYFEQLEYSRIAYQNAAQVHYFGNPYPAIVTSIQQQLPSQWRIQDLKYDQEQRINLPRRFL